jgi:hypothetical protein
MREEREAPGKADIAQKYGIAGLTACNSPVH